MKLFPVILSGGSGSRLWPVSRKDFPKQFIALTAADKSLLQLTHRRLTKHSGLNNKLEDPIIITNEEYRFMVQRDLRESNIKSSGIILEPERRNTAPAIGLAASYLAEQGAKNDLMLVLPADAFIKEEEDFANYINIGVEYFQSQAASGKKFIGTFGVKPSFPHTGYGYIKTNNKISDEMVNVESFVEKPDQERAKAYIRDGDYYWNCGIFLMTVSTYIDKLKEHAPDIYNAVAKSVNNAKTTDGFIYPDSASFTASPADSIDYAVMEKDKNIALVPMDITWSDVGSWDSLAKLYDHDEDGNSVKGNAVLSRSKDTFVFSSSDRLITALGVEDIAIVDTPDALLVTRRGASEEVKQLLEGLNPRDYPQAVEQYRSYRPWGWYESLIKRDGFQVKRLAVYPGAKLSLQSHKHRSEHWVVVQGQAIVTCDEKNFTLSSNQSTYIPLGAKHRLANPGDELLVVIEVQNGDYLGEDDIIRYEDIYDRS